MLLTMRRAARLLLCLILVGNIAGCAERMPELPPAPIVFEQRDCPTPSRPNLPVVDGTLPFDAPENVSAIMRRDTILKNYAKGLEAAVDCYRKARKETPDARGTATAAH